MVKDHYQKLGFNVLDNAEDGSSHSALDLATFIPASTFIDVKEA
jgi:hypothetical protein